MFFKKKRKCFDRELFENAVGIIKNLQQNNCAKNEIPMQYKYLGDTYTKLVYKYKIDADNRVQCVLFSLPKTAANQHMSCLVISGANTAEEAIANLKNISSNKYA
jgi:hypothetical protein